MYQIDMRAQASKLASLTARWQIARAQRPVAADRDTAHLHAATSKLATLATLRAMPGCSPSAAARPDPRDPRNW
jgi:hypothetical protein